MQLETIKLSTIYLTRPKGQLGNVGSYPFLWTATQGKTAKQAEQAFINMYNKQIKELDNAII